MSPREFFEAALQYSGNSCLLWPYALQTNRYSKIGIDGKVQTAHRAVCLAVHGPAPEGHDAAHSCGNRTCLTPKHLRWATKIDNAADMVAHGTVLAGELNPQAKLSRAQVEHIRAMKGIMLQKDLAAAHGVTQALISKVQRGHIWRDSL